MNKIILTSTRSDLRNLFNSDLFISANYDTHYENDTFKRVLRMSFVPNVGDYLYFINDYYAMIAVRVDKIVRTNSRSSHVMVYCLPAEMKDIDSYMFDIQLSPNPNHHNFTQEFVDDVLNAAVCIADRAQKAIEKNIADYGEETTNKIAFYSRFIIDYLGLEEKTIIDWQNLSYCVCEILGQHLKDFNGWERPNTFC